MTLRSISRRNLFASVAALLAGVPLAVAACSAGGAGDALFSGSPTSSGTGGGATGVGGSESGGAGGSIFTTTGTTTTVGSCTTPCQATEICSHGTCVPFETCSTDDECSNDTRCDPAVGCVPWDDADPKADPECIFVTAAGMLSPKVRCEFSVAPPNDVFPGHVDVQGTPIVVNMNGFEGTPDTELVPIGSPSIAASFTATVPGGYTENAGVVRVLSGKDCSLEANLGGIDEDADGAIDWTYSSASLAAADLDGDGLPEIVAYGADGSTLAWTRKAGVYSLLWKARTSPGGAVYIAPINGGWAGPAIHDLDDDGVPEVLREGAVLSHDGVLLAAAPAAYASYSQGLFSVTANLDQDPAIETTNGQYVWEWQAGGWVQEAYFPGASSSAPGHVAVADFGAYGQLPPQNPELAVVRDGYAMVYAATGELAQDPIAIPGGGGGPPTVADFDGDGLPELAVAGQAYYTIFDIDCGASPRPTGICPMGICDSGPCPSGVAWSKTTQDISSNITGSSVFDFEADGKAEVVYADECFVRVYSGITGEVIFSQYRSSCTWYENPVIADVDGNFRADLVTPSNKACSPTGDGMACNNLTADGVDIQFAGLRCDTAADCVSGACDSGLCRCTTGAQCCSAQDEAACLEVGYKCSPPPAGTPGAGNTCRAAHPHGVSGIRVYSDENDKWVRSRMIWNQHAYAVTHVHENATVPKTSEWKNNWEVAGLNNFRTNVPGSAGGAKVPDTTAGASSDYACQSGAVTLSSPICNRGAAPLGAGVAVGFYAGGQLVCETVTTKPILPEACEIVACVWDSPPTVAGEAVDVTVRPNHTGELLECKNGNNEGVIVDVYCKQAG